MQTDEGDLYVVNGRIFVTSKEAIVEFLPATKSFRMLASARRRSSTNELEQVESFDRPVLGIGPGDGIRAIVAGNSYLLNGTEWRKETSWTKAFTIMRSAGAVFSVGRQEWPRPLELFVMRAQQRTPELEIRTGIESYSDGVSEGSGTPGVKAKWNVGRNLAFSDAPFLMGENLALFRQNHETYTGAPDSPNAFLTVFVPGSPECIELPIRFHNTTEMVAKGAQGLGGELWFIEEGKYFLCGNPLDIGFWRIPKAAIEQAVAEALKKRTPTETAKAAPAN